MNVNEDYPTGTPPSARTRAVYFRWPEALILELVQACAARRLRGEEPWTQAEVAALAMREWLDKHATPAVGRQASGFQRVYQLAMSDPFEPFAVVLEGGARYPVCSRDHIFFIRDDGGGVIEADFQIVTGGQAHRVASEAVSAVELL
jgi:hypothetical protein